jgi:pimeloyl-ACP methyl ester carboxylesterase
MFSGLVLALALAGPAHAQPAKDPSLSVYARPQQLVTLADGRRINLDCAGQGRVTVVLIAGLNGGASLWSKVKAGLAPTTRVCAWDPPGLGWSDPSPQPQDAAHAAADLTAALKAAGIGGPYLLVAHSAGAYPALLAADAHRPDLAGLVLVDPSIPDMIALEAAAAQPLADFDRADLARMAKVQRDCAAQLRAGQAPAKGCGFYFPEMPDDLVAALRRLDADPARIETRASIAEQFEASSRQAVNPARDYGDLPLIVLTAGRAPWLPPELAAESPKLSALWTKGHDALAALSRRGVNRTVEGAGHMIPLERPDAVTGAVLEVLKAF